MFFRIRLALVAISFVALDAIATPAQAGNVAPTIAGTPKAAVFSGFRYRFMPQAQDVDNDVLRFSISNKPGWATFDNRTGRLTGTPRIKGTYQDIVIRVSDGVVTRSLPAFSIRVGWNHAPRIKGVPRTRVAAGSAYFFKPIATDRDRQKLRFSITGKPAWAVFSKTTGRLYGRPRSASSGTSSRIRITVWDGKKSDTLPAFRITVTPPTARNRAPVIAGSAVTSASVNRPYAFKPTASDADTDLLTFRISGKPVWARFDTTNGTLFGTPTAAHIGAYPNIRISVSDGKTTASLAPFGVVVGTGSTRSVTLSWATPTRNTDGSALTDLAGYRIFYGRDSRHYSESVTVRGADVTSMVLDGLAPGAWYFSMRSVDRTASRARTAGRYEYCCDRPRFE